MLPNLATAKDDPTAASLFLDTADRIRHDPAAAAVSPHFLLTGHRPVDQP
jgi:hypothetical protein